VTNPDLLARFERAAIDINAARVEIAKAETRPEVDLDQLKRKLEDLAGAIETIPLPKVAREKRKDDFLAVLKQIEDDVRVQIAHLNE